MLFLIFRRLVPLRYRSPKFAKALWYLLIHNQVTKQGVKRFKGAFDPHGAGVTRLLQVEEYLRNEQDDPTAEPGGPVHVLGSMNDRKLPLVKARQGFDG